jgi:UDP-glucose 4-epimerase
MTIKVLVTGSSGYLGSVCVNRLAQNPDMQVIAVDLRLPAKQLPGVIYETSDIRAPELEAIIARHQPETVVHLAAIMPSAKSDRAFEYSVDVGGTKNLLDACVKHAVKRIIISSSGAAYGYHPDNPEWLTENDPIRGNEIFAYSHHKRLVEEMLAEYRKSSPQLEQVIFRIGTILGPTVKNQITDMFEKPRILAVAGSDSPFVFIHDEDVVGAILHGIRDGKPGAYNVAGDGKLTIYELAKRLGKPCLTLPAFVITSALWLLKKLGLSQYGPEQLYFLRYRPVLLNTRLKEEFGYRPKLSSADVFELYRTARQKQANQ